LSQREVGISSFTKLPKIMVLGGAVMMMLESLIAFVDEVK
jgi:hypothetical protein